MAERQGVRASHRPPGYMFPVCTKFFLKQKSCSFFLWGIFISVRILCRGRLGNNKSTVFQNADEQNELAASPGPDGFKFFKRKSTVGLVADNEAALRKIEKEMLMVRKQYVDGHMLQDVYVAETRRLYNIAKPFKP